MEMTVTNAEGKPTEYNSPCWDLARERFLEEIRSSNKFSESALEAFLNNNFRIDRTINSCQTLKSKVDAQYNGTKRAVFVGKLLNVLRTVKEVGDGFLECAPETVSIAWCAISLLIKVGTDDLDKCDMVSGACENIVTIILNCRLYENRYQSSAEGESGDDVNDMEKKIFASIPDVLFAILDFAWHTQYHLDKNKFLRSFKEAFNDKIKTKIDAISAAYASLREMGQDVFQERVFDYMLNMTNLVKAMEKNSDEMKEILFPSLEEIQSQIDSMDKNITSRLDLEELRNKYKDNLKKLNASEIHTKQFLAMFEPIRQEYENMALWLFTSDDYLKWEDISNRNIALLCLKGSRGFGKSVKMTCVTKRLMDLTRRTKGTVLHFYFKRGDEASQVTIRGLESLLCQLLDHRAIWEDDEMMKSVLKMLQETQNGDIKISNAAITQIWGVGGLQGPTVLRTPEMISQTLAKVADMLSFPVYLVIDALDECEDRVAGNLIPSLKYVARSSNKIKVIMSVRDNVDIEKLFEESKTANHDGGGSEDLTGSEVCDSSSDTCSDIGSEKEAIDDATEPVAVVGTEIALLDAETGILPRDLKFIVVDEKNNSEDMKMYLSKKLAPLISRRVSEKNTRAYAKELDRIVEKVKAKANGNFSYAAMVVANLYQPSRESLETRLNAMPSAMEGMYRKSLETLSPEERRLVIYALKWIVWGSGELRVFEIVEHYKAIYDPNDNGEPAVSEDAAEDSEEEIQSSEFDPEISDVIYHLRTAGRDFFKIDDMTGTIDVHLSVREWVNAESKQYEDSPENQKSMVPTFSKDPNGHWSVTFPIPPNVADNDDSLRELFNKREAHLDITLNILRALNSKRFLNKYLPWDPPEDWKDFWEEKRLELSGSKATAGEKQDAIKSTTKVKELEEENKKQIVVESDENSPNRLSNGSHELRDDAGAPTPSQSKSEEAENKTAVAKVEAFTGKEKIPTPTVADKGSQSGTVQDDVAHDEKPNIGEDNQVLNGDLPAKKPDPVQDEAEMKSWDGRNSDLDVQNVEGSHVSEVADLNTDRDPAMSKRPRFELSTFAQQLQNISNEWKEEEMTGPEWTELLLLATKFFRIPTWRRYVAYFRGRSHKERRWGYSPLAWSLPVHMLARNGLDFLIEHLIKQNELTKAEINAINTNNYRPLGSAILSNKMSTIETLIKHGADINLDCRGLTDMISFSLVLAAAEGAGVPSWGKEMAIKSTNYFIEKGADLTRELNPKNLPGYTKLMCAAFTSQELTKVVLEKMPQDMVNAKETKAENTALHMAIQRGSEDEVLEKVKALIEHGADVNAQNLQSEGPLKRAIQRHLSKVVEILIDHGADVHDDDVFGEIGLHSIAGGMWVRQADFSQSERERAVLSIADKLSNAGLDFERKAKDGSTALFKAVKFRNETLVRWFIDRYLERYNGDRGFLLQEDLHGRNLFYRSCAHHEPSLVITKLISEGLTEEQVCTCLTRQDNDKGYTALHIATLHGNIDLIEYILSLSKDVASIRDSSGKTALDVASLALEKPQSKNKKTKDGKFHNYRECYAKLLPVTDTTVLEKSLHLHNAVRSHAEDIMKLLADMGADPEVTDEDGWNAFHFGLYGGAEKLLRTYFPDYPHNTIYHNLPSPKVPSRMNENRKGKGATISEDGLQITSTGITKHLVLTDHPIPVTQSRYYFEVTFHWVSDTPIKRDFRQAAIGLQKETTNRYDDAMVGWYHGHGFHADDAKIFHGTTGKLYRSIHGPDVRTYAQSEKSETVGCGVDIRKGTVFFTLNGEYLGRAGKIDITAARWYPAVSLRCEHRLEMNLGGSPFQFQRAYEDIEVLEG